MGRRVAVYRIDEFLGEGGFAFVYKARDTNLDIDVALKILKPAFAYDEVFEQNFRREAHRAAKFRHPNVVAIHYAGKDNDVVFFSMDLLERGLTDVLAGGRPAGRNLIIKVGMDVASALQFAHTHEGGIVHRDLKPDNILFDRHGNAVVTDFGIAEAATNYTQATGTTVYVGTPKYMSPEQARGQRVDHRSDIYSLGVTLYELATGEPLFVGRDWFELGRKHIEELPPLPREKNSTLDEHLELIIIKCLQKNPLDRYQSAEQLRSDLAAVSGTGSGPVSLSVRPSDVLPRTSSAASRPERTTAPSQAQAPSARPPRKRRRRVFLPLALLVALVGTVVAYDYNVAELRTIAEERFPVLSGIPYLGSGQVYPTAFWYATIEGGAEIEPRLDLRFSGPIDPATATGSHVHLSDPEGRDIPVEITVVDSGRRISIRPTQRLDYQTEYSLRIGSGLLGAGGDPILQSAQNPVPGASFTFTTRQPPPDTEAPFVTESTPADGAAEASPGGPITVTFNEPVDPTTVTSRTIELLDRNGRPVEIRVFTAEGGRSARIEPTVPLQSDGRYSLILMSGITDLSGNPALSDTVSFKVGAGDAARARAEPARLSVRVVPARAAPLVRLVLDGRDTTSLPNLNLRLPPGRHEIELLGSPPYSAYYLQLHEESFTLVPGEVRELAPQVNPFGWITVTSEPVADVFVDGNFVATTPVAGYALPAGPHKLELHPTAENVGRAGIYSGQVNIPEFEELNLGRIPLPPAR